MPYPYKKMDENDFEAIRRFTDDSRVWVGDEIAREYYHDEMPNYGTYPPELYVEVLNKEEVSAILAYAYEKNIPVGQSECPSRIYDIFVKGFKGASDRPVHQRKRDYDNGKYRGVPCHGHLFSQYRIYKSSHRAVYADEFKQKESYDSGRQHQRQGKKAVQYPLCRPRQSRHPPGEKYAQHKCCRRRYKRYPYGIVKGKPVHICTSYAGMTNPAFSNTSVHSPVLR